MTFIGKVVYTGSPGTTGGGHGPCHRAGLPGDYALAIAQAAHRLSPWS